MYRLSAKIILYCLLSISSSASIVSISLAQSCADDPESIRLTEDLFECMTEMAVALNEAAASLASANEQLEDAELALENALLRLNRDRSSLSRVTLILEQALVAFAGPGCPEGWQVFDSASDRFIVAAGERMEFGSGESDEFFFTIGPNNLPGHTHNLHLDSAQVNIVEHDLHGDVERPAWTIEHANIVDIVFLLNRFRQREPVRSRVAIDDSFDGLGGDFRQIDIVPATNVIAGFGGGVVQSNVQPIDRRPPFFAVTLCRFLG